MSYSYLKTIKKSIFIGAIFVAVVSLQFLVDTYPALMQITMGTIVTFGITFLKDYLKHKIGIKLP